MIYLLLGGFEVSAKTRLNRRQVIGEQTDEVLEIPNLIKSQFESYERLLQLEKIKKGEPLKREGLEEVFLNTFPVVNSAESLTLEYGGYTLDYENIRQSELECRKLATTYGIPLKADFNLIFHETGEVRSKNVFLGILPLMTDRGTFIINGAERVVVSQIHRSPGVIFSSEKDLYYSRIIPYRGSWLEFEIETKKDILYVKIDRKKKILASSLLRALGVESREKIIDIFYKTKNITVSTKDSVNQKNVGGVYAKPVYFEENGEQKKIYQAGERVHLHHFDELTHAGISKVALVDFDHEKSLKSDAIINCFDREVTSFDKDNPTQDEPTQSEAVLEIRAILSPGESVSAEQATEDLKSMFFTSNRYDLGAVGRYKLNQKMVFPDSKESSVLDLEDITSTMQYLMKVSAGDEKVDDIDHLGNRRIRSVGELLQNQLKTAFVRVERIARDRMNQRDHEDFKPQELLPAKPIMAAVKEFFGSSQLSQFMDQVNPLAELTHKRRLSALGPGGLSRDRAGFEVRDIHYSHYGRMCPIETPEGPNIGLIMSLSNYARINNFGFLETPYRKVVDGKVTNTIDYLPALEEDKYTIAQASAPLEGDGAFRNDTVAVRRAGDYLTDEKENIDYMDVSPRQLVSSAASLIPFLEHDDANRALMGCNMQRQAVPLLFPQAPLVGTGLEKKVAYDTGVVAKASVKGTVSYVAADEIRISGVDGKEETCTLVKYQRTNQDTSFNQVPIVRVGDEVEAGDVIADGPATQGGELALGKNLLVGFVPWNGYNFEDAVLISEKVVREDYYTSVHIKEFTVEARDTKLGIEKITRDIPNVSEKQLENLDEDGVIRVGAKVKPGSILVGKTTPRNDGDTTPEFKLLNSIFGEKVKDVKDSSLRVSHGIEGTIIDIQRLKRSMPGHDLQPGVEEEIKVYIASKRKLKEGDKMAGRHGNKGVIAKILPEEDMPFLPDGTSLDVCLNPLGVPSRMNIGQLLETMLGMAGAQLGKMYETRVFQSAEIAEIEAELEAAGIEKSCKQPLYDGLTGEKFSNDVTVGYMYYLKLHHLVDDKMHARSTGPYSLVTQQPLGGKAQFGGQRFGEMEVWALEAYGAAHTLQELMTFKSDDMTGRSKVYESIVKGTEMEKSGTPESFNVLMQELRGLGLDVQIFDDKGNTLPLTERDAELIQKEERNF